MKYLQLGNTDLNISRICLGCMTYGEPSRGNHAWTLPEESSRPLIKQALDAGINFFDTSNNYSDGSSEEIVGRALRDYARRDEVVIATKVYNAMSNLERGLSRPKIHAVDSTTACGVWVPTTSIYCKSTVGTMKPQSKRRWKPCMT